MEFEQFNKAKGRHTRGDQSLRLVFATSPLKSLKEGPGRRDSTHEQFTYSVLRNRSLGFVSKIRTGLNSWDLPQGQNFSP